MHLFEGAHQLGEILVIPALLHVGIIRDAVQTPLLTRHVRGVQMQEAGNRRSARLREMG